MNADDNTREIDPTVPERDRDYPTSLRIGPVLVEPNVVLAPMEGVTDLSFRRLIRSIGGPGLTCTEFIASSGLREGKGRVWDQAAFDDDERPVTVQIYGNEPGRMAEAARILADRGASIIDINMGCPSKRVCQRSGGSALMKDMDHAVTIVRAVKAAVSVPVTVKMRSGFDHSDRNAPELAWRCVQEGAEAITVHWRTRADGYKGERVVDKIAETVDRVPVPVLGNGDIIDLPSAKAMLDDTGCRGLMVGRGAIRNLWLPLMIGQWLRGEAIVRPTATGRRDALRTFCESVLAAFRTEKGALGRMKMMCNQYALDLPHGPGVRRHLLRSKSVPELLGHVDRYFAALEAAEAGAEDAFADTPYPAAAAALRGSPRAG